MIILMIIDDVDNDDVGDYDGVVGDYNGDSVGDYNSGVGDYDSVGGANDGDYVGVGVACGDHGMY